MILITSFLSAHASSNTHHAKQEQRERKIASETKYSLPETVSEENQVIDIDQKKLLGTWKNIDFKCRSGAPFTQKDPATFDRFSYTNSFEITDKFIVKKEQLDIKYKKDKIKIAKKNIRFAINSLTKKPHNLENKEKLLELKQAENQFDLLEKGITCSHEVSAEYVVHGSTMSSKSAKQTFNSCPSNFTPGNNFEFQVSFKDDHLVLSYA
ncbi:MAG: hypothetical protein H6623_09640, partial [Bdellovibrionaceae bacterium]|nr:hypothetical protein [Pseudobdellovibrionaceae bacterium]